MPNRHVPHSDISNPPRSHVACHYCRAPIRVQHVDPPHACTEHCHPHGAEHDYRMEQRRPIVRYFTDAGEEFCKDCFMKEPHQRPRHGVRQ